MKGLFRETITGEKYQGIGRKPLGEFASTEHFIDFNGGFGSPVHMTEATDGKTTVIEVKDTYSLFYGLLIKLKQHLNMYMTKLAVKKAYEEEIEPTKNVSVEVQKNEKPDKAEDETKTVDENS